MSLSNIIQVIIIIVPAVFIFVLFRKNIRLIKIQNQKDKFFLLFENMPDSVVVHEIVVNEDRKVIDFEFVEINAAFEELTGISRKDLIGRRLSECLPLVEKTTDYWIDLYSEVIYEGVRKKIEHYSPVIGKWFNISVYRISLDSFVSILEDITEKKEADIEFQRTKKRLQYLISESPAVIYTFNLNDTPELNFVSDNIKNVLGYQPTRFSGSIKLWLDGIHEDERYSIDEMLQQLKTNGKNTLEYRYLDSKGQYRWIHDDQAVMKETDNGQQMVIGSFIDITELKRSEEKFAAIFYSNASIMVITKLKTGEFVDVNDQFLKILNYNREDVIGRSATAVGLFPDSKMEKDIIREIYQKGCVRNKNVEAYRKNGEKVYGILSIDIFLKEDEPLLITMVVDITELKKMEKALLRSEERYRELVENANSIILRLNPEGRIIFFNDFAQKFFGYTEEEIIGSNVIGSIIPAKTESNDELLTEITDIINKPEKYTNHENINVKKNGESVWIFWNNKVIYDEKGNVKEILSIGNDISDRKKAEEKLMQAIEEADAARENAQKATKAKSEFIAAMSHEIRTPMNSIMGMTNLALMTDDEDEKLDYLTTVRLSADHLMSVINDILDFSKIEAGKMTIDINTFDLHSQVNGILSSLKHKAIEKNLDLKFEIDPSIPRIIAGDSSKIMQVLINLIGNSLKFTETGQVKVLIEKVNSDHLSEYSKDDMQCFIKFSVEDTGIGIPEDKLDEIFESFTQAENSISRNYGGTGLGLTISTQLVKLMGGEIYVESVLGEGALFYFVLPLKAGESSAPGEEYSTAIETEKNIINTELKILLAEDNPVNQKLALVILTKLGYNLEAAWNGLEVLKKIRQDKFDVILMDLEMPGMGGFEATEKIRRGDAGEENKDIPILAMTAHVLSDYKEVASDSGMNGFIVKPIDFNDLILSLNSISKKRQK